VKRSNSTAIFGMAVLVSLSIVAMPATGGAAASANVYESLYPFLIPLPGWEAGESAGVNIDEGGWQMINASREYTRGEQSLAATILIGNLVTEAAATVPDTMDVDSSQARMAVKTIRGFRVTLAHDKVERSGAVTVLLLPPEQAGAAFVLAYKELSDEEAMALAQKFDWEKMREKVRALLPR
jgi:hypothetical protein